jgi:hypothetical protein
MSISVLVLYRIGFIDLALRNTDMYRMGFLKYRYVSVCRNKTDTQPYNNGSRRDGGGGGLGGSSRNMSGACNCQGRHRRGGRAHLHNLRQRGIPIATLRPSSTFFVFKLMTHQSFFHDKLYTLQARRDPHEGHTRLQATQAEESRGKRSPAPC